MQSLNPSNFLRKYSSVFEYLNKFNIKLVDINCLLELFLLELEIPLIDDTISNSIRDLSSATELNLESQMLKSCDQFSQALHNTLQARSSFHPRLETNFSENHPQNDDNLGEKCEYIRSNSMKQNKNSRHELKRSYSENQQNLDDNLEMNNKQQVNVESILISGCTIQDFIDHAKKSATEQDDNQSAKNSLSSSEKEDYLTGVDSPQRSTDSTDSVVLETEVDKPQEESVNVIKTDIPDKNSILARINARENQHNANIVPIPDLRPTIATKKHNNNFEYSDDNSNSSISINIIKKEEAIKPVETVKENQNSNESRLKHTRENNTIHFQETKNTVETNKKSNHSNEPRLKHTRENNFGMQVLFLYKGNRTKFY